MRTRLAVINIAAGLVGLLVTTVIGFLSSATFARNLGVEISGLNNVLANVISFLSVTELGIAGAINYNLYKPVLEKDYATISRIMTFYRKCYTVIGAVILTVSLIVAGFVHHLIKDSTLSRMYICSAFLLCAANTVLSYYLVYYRNLLYVFQETYLSSIMDLLFRLVCSVLQILCLIKLKNYHLYLLINLFFTFFSNLAVTLIVRRRYPQVSTNEKTRDLSLQRKVMHDVKSLAVIQIGSAMINFTSSIIISKMIGIRTAGMYAYYATLITILTSIISMVFSNLGAGIGNLLAENKNEPAVRVFRTLTHFCFLLGLIVASGLGNAVKPFIQFWVGNEFVLGYEIAVVLAINFYIMVQRQVVTYYLRTGGYHDRMLLALAVEAVVNLSASIFLASKFGLIGVFAGVMLASLIGWPMNAKTLSDVLGISFIRYIGTQFCYLAFFIVQLFVSNWVITSLNLQCNVLLQFIISGVISVAIPVIVSAVDVLCNPTLRSIRDKLLSFVKR